LNAGWVLPVLLAIPWLLLPALVLLRVRNRPRLEGWEPVGRTDPPGDAPLVSVIVPARDEEGAIARCLRSVLRSEYPRLEVLVVDDQSQDATAAIVESIADADGRVRLVRGDPLPGGWFGKPWACVQGARQATGEYLAFTDADVVHHPELLGRALRALWDRGAGLVTVLPRQLLESFWERLIMPQVLLLILFRYPDPERVNRSPHAHDKIANGQFILVPRTAYDRVGGHEAVRHEVAEDLRLAQHFHSCGFPVLLTVADRFMDVRMYDSLGAIVEGWSKNVATGSSQSVPERLRPFVPWFLLSWVALVWLLPPAVLPLAALGVLGRGWLVWATLTTTVSVAFWARVHARFRTPAALALLYPLAALVTAWIVARSAVRGGRVRWKGRDYRPAADGTAAG
jgi:chlorobactene glucosyltransferase